MEELQASKRKSPATSRARPRQALGDRHHDRGDQEHGAQLARREDDTQSDALVNSRRASGAVAIPFDCDRRQLRFSDSRGGGTVTDDGITISKRTLRRAGGILAALLLFGAGYAVGSLASSSNEAVQTRASASPQPTSPILAPPTTAATTTTVAPTTAPTTTTPPTTAPLPVLVVPSVYGSAGYSGRFPRTIDFSGDAGNIVGGISWSSWGPDPSGRSWNVDLPRLRTRLRQRISNPVSRLTAFASRAAQTNVGPPGGSATRSPTRSATGSVSCFDPSGHTTSFVTVEPGVRLEVLDWGGHGDPLVLLTGLGDNAHVYDHFAYQFTESFHVIGITRRGFGRSSKPAWGYDVDTRARDDIRVLDNLNMRRAVFVGHSVAGDELSKLGVVYPDRVEKLVYLDAYDYGKLFTLPEPPSPEFAKEDLASVERFAAASARYNVREPNTAICNSFHVDAAGAIVAAISPPWVTQKLKAGSQEAEYDRIRAPALAIFAPLTAQARTPAYWYLDPAQQVIYRRNFKALAEWQMDAIRRFRSGIKKSRVVELPGANHYVFIDNEAVVVREMHQFLLGKP